MSESIHILVRGVIAVERQILLAHAKGAPNIFLPGGHVELGERVTEALSRELTEEFGQPGHVERYLGAIEHQWKEGERIQHEINHVFGVSLPNVSPRCPIVSCEAHLEFHWAPVQELSKFDLRPAPLIELIHHYVDGEVVPFFGSTF